MTMVYVNKDARGRDRATDEQPPTAAWQMPLTAAGGQGGVIAPGPRDRLARRVLDHDEQAAIWWLGAHGGAGESTLEELFSGSCAADHSWPLSATDPAPRVVLVARTHAHGLKAAQGAIREWAAGDTHVLLLGLVLIADAPGRLPHGLRQLADLIAGGVPAVWSLPWIEAWRIGEPPAAHNAPKVVRRLLEDLQAMTETAVTRTVNRKGF